MPQYIFKQLFSKKLFSAVGAGRGESGWGVLGRRGTSGLWLVLLLNLGGELLSQLGCLSVRMLYSSEKLLLERNCFSQVTCTHYNNLFPSTRRDIFVPVLFCSINKHIYTCVSHLVGPYC